MSSLLNLENIPNGEISGISTECLDWVTDESNERFITELSASFAKDLEKIEAFENVGEDVLTMLKTAESSSVPMSTQKQTKNHVKKFKSFLMEKNLSVNIEKAPSEILANYLSYFYYSLRTKEGKPYSPASLICIRAAIQRYLNSPEINRKIDLVNGKDYVRCNGVLKMMVKMWMENGGKETGNKFDSIETEDLKKMSVYFDRSTPQRLQQEAWFSLVYYLALRGREILHDLPVNAICFGEDSEGKSFVYINKTYITKNVKVSLSQKEFENLSQARVYENTDNPENCPVTCLRSYISKIPKECTYLFPLALKKPTTNGIWYCERRSLGKNAIGKMMSDISQSAMLRYRFTNHCVRVTVVSNLKNSGMEAEDIAAVTGHKNVHSVERYVRRKRDSEKERVSAILCNSLANSPAITTYEGTSLKIQKFDDKIINVTTGLDAKYNDGKIIIYGNTNCTFNFNS